MMLQQEDVVPQRTSWMMHAQMLLSTAHDDDDAFSYRAPRMMPHLIVHRG